MEKNKNGRKVCVTGGSGYIASWLVKKLLERGYTVHATLRNFDDESKVNLLKNLPGAEARLELFMAHIYEPDGFENAIRGCEFVFHVATPLFHSEGFQYKNTTEATIASAKRIAASCVLSGTVRRLIYTATVISASPIKADGRGFKEVMDETCWTPLDIPIPHSNDFLKDYQVSKTLAEKELLDFGNNINGDQLEVVTLACGLVGGDTVLPFTPVTVGLFVSQLTNNAMLYNSLKYMEELIGKIPIIHIDDVCEAHIFCIENSNARGRILCASSFVSSAEIANYYQDHCPQFQVKKEYFVELCRKIELDSSKLIKNGFKYKYDTNMILDDSLGCAMRMGDL